MATGIFASNYNPPDFAQKSFGLNITKLMPNGMTSLLALTSLFSFETAKQIEHGFWVESMIFPELELTAQASATDTVLNVVSTENILPNTMFQTTGVIATARENLIIDSVLSATQVRVSRGLGSVAPAIIPVSTKLIHAGSAFEESSLRPNAMSIPPIRVSNYTQIFRDTWAMSGTAAATKVITGVDPVGKDKNDGAGFHAMSLEKAFIFGQRYMGTRNNQPFHLMDGLIQMIGNPAFYPSYAPTPNVTHMGGTTTWAQLESSLDGTQNQVTTDSSGNERVILCGSNFRKVVNNLGRLYGYNGAAGSTIQYTDSTSTTSFGLNFTSFVTTRGRYVLMEHPMFNTNADMQKMGLVLNVGQLKVAYMEGRNTDHKYFNKKGDESAEDNGIDAIGGTYTTECTITHKNPASCAIITNMTAAA